MAGQPKITEKQIAAEVIDKESLELYRGMDIVCDILIPKLRSAARKISSQPLAY